MSFDRWMDKENVVHTDTMEYYSATKKWNNAICSNVDGPDSLPVELPGKPIKRMK